MAKLLKHLGISGGGKKTSTSPVSSGTRFDCDRIRPQFTESNNEAFVPAPSISAQVNSESENSLDSTVSSAVRSTLASNDLYLAVSSVDNSSLNASDSNQHGRFSSVYNFEGNNVIGDYLKPKNIYENHDMFASPTINIDNDEGNNNVVSAGNKHATLFNEDCWNEVKKWLQEMSEPNKRTSPPSTSCSSATSNSHPPSQTDIENARFLSDILTVLQQARSEVFKDITSKQTPSHQLVGSPKIRVGGLLTEVAMKLESEYEKARNSLTTKDYERYTRLKELLKSELEEPIYGLKMCQFEMQPHPNQRQQQQFVKQQQQYLQKLQQQPNINNKLQQENILDLSTASTSPRGSACYDEPWNSDEVQNDIMQDHLPVRKLTAGKVLNSDNSNNNNVNDINGNNNVSESANSDSNCNINANFTDVTSNDICGNEIDDANNNVLGSVPSSTSGVVADTSQTIIVAAATDTAAVTHNLDLRTRTGYEPPWDWKPHQKDNRKQEGYEKPWDLKPHDKDNRSSKEYEEPWDNKGLKVESELIAAKLAKDAQVTSKQEAPVSKPPSKKDYDDPWDQKSKDVEMDVITAKIAKETVRIGFSNPAINNSNNNNNVNMNNNNSSNVNNNVNNIANVGVNNVNGSGDAGVGCSKGVSILGRQQQPSQQHLHHQLNVAAAQASSSPFKKPLPPLPASSTSPSSSASPPSSLSPSQQQQQLAARQLLDQIWYHGKLGRAGAESVLQRHREASFLVRRSENRPDEYSLSVRSSKGFMHLKINNDDSGRFILGQFSQPFISMQQMVQYYATNKLPIKGAEHISLLHPVSKSTA